MGRRVATRVWLVATAVVIAAPGVAWGRAGDLDTSFGHGGMQAIDFGGFEAGFSPGH